jgi:hypothetical protein
MSHMDELEATWLLNLLRERYPESDIDVTPEDDGAQIVITDARPSPGATNHGGATSLSVRVADADSLVLRYLLR